MLVTTTKVTMGDSRVPRIFGMSDTMTCDAFYFRLLTTLMVGFLHQIMGKQERQKSDGSWETPAAKEVLHVVGIQLDPTYTGRCKAKLA